MLINHECRHHSPSWSEPSDGRVPIVRIAVGMRVSVMPSRHGGRSSLDDVRKDGIDLRPNTFTTHDLRKRAPVADDNAQNLALRIPCGPELHTLFRCIDAPRIVARDSHIFLAKLRENRVSDWRGHVSVFTNTAHSGAKRNDRSGRRRRPGSLRWRW